MNERCSCCGRKASQTNQNENYINGSGHIVFSVVVVVVFFHSCQQIYVMAIIVIMVIKRGWWHRITVLLFGIYFTECGLHSVIYRQRCGGREDDGKGRGEGGCLPFDIQHNRCEWYSMKIEFSKDINISNRFLSIIFSITANGSLPAIRQTAYNWSNIYFSSYY